jgi:glycosyltransferase involved in cell wall biosynthesis
VQLWSFAPDVDYLCGQFGEECVVYYCVDEFSEFSGYDPAAIREAEARLARRADLVVTTSQALYEAKRRLSENVVLVTHGVDYEHFARATARESAVPADIAGLPRPVLGFWGLIQDWLDVELVAEVARRRPAWSVVLIGEAATDASALRGLPNVYLLGRRAYGELPAYAKGFDIAMIPFRVNALTQAVNPIKLREYLSAGLPVVSAPLPEVRAYGEWVRIATDAGEFVAACEEIWAAEGPRRRDGASAFAAARQSAMRGETWAAKVEGVSRYVEECLARNGMKKRGEGEV